MAPQRPFGIPHSICQYPERVDEPPVPRTKSNGLVEVGSRLAVLAERGVRCAEGMVGVWEEGIDLESLVVHHQALVLLSERLPEDNAEVEVGLVLKRV